MEGEVEESAAHNNEPVSVFLASSRESDQIANKPQLKGQPDFSNPNTKISHAPIDQLYENDSKSRFEGSKIRSLYSYCLTEETPKYTSIRPPLTTQHLEALTFRRNFKDLSSDLFLTDALIWQLNTVFRCNTKIHQYLKRLSANDAEQVKLRKMEQECGELLEILASEEERAKFLRSLEEIQEWIHNAKKKKRALETKLEAVRKEVQSSKCQVFRDLKRVLKDSNLLDAVSEHSGDGQDHNTASEQDCSDQVHQETILFTTSEALFRARIANEQAARDMVRSKEIALQNSRRRLDNWNRYYEQEYKQFCKWKDEGGVAITKSEFDVMLLREAQDATRNLIQAENDLDDAKAHARDLGVVCDPAYQESGFLDCVDDGYRESVEADLIGTVDRGGIERWMEEQDTKPEPSTECDCWSAKAVDFCDSISVVADGKERKRIDRWRETCELVGIEIEAQRSIHCNLPLTNNKSSDPKQERVRRSL